MTDNRSHAVHSPEGVKHEPSAPCIKTCLSVCLKTWATQRCGEALHMSILHVPTDRGGGHVPYGQNAASPLACHPVPTIMRAIEFKESWVIERVGMASDRHRWLQ